MADGFSWSESRASGAYRLPGPDHLGWWAAVAMLVSILLHVVVFFALDQMKIAIKFEEAKELSTRQIDVRQVEISPARDERSEPPDENIITPPKDTSTLLEEIDLLAKLPDDIEIDIKPGIVEAEYALKMQNPAIEGDPTAIAMELSSNLEIDGDLPELGRQPESIRPAEVGQLTVDPGAINADDTDLGSGSDLIKYGAGGKTETGTIDGVTSLENMLDLPPNLLLGSKTMLPSDLLFEFNSSELKESAKIGLMKLGLLMDRNPNLYCWIEGHTDLVGGDEFNLDLSIKRAESVKTYLASSLRMDAAKIYTRGFGRYEPIRITGTTEEQSVNRRVEIRMRKTPPTKEQLKIAPQKVTVVEETPAPKPILVKPKLPLPVEEVPAPPMRAQPVEPTPNPPLKATPIEETPPLRALPAFPEVPHAEPVEPRMIPRAEPIQEE
jgi:OOP family OmpA-OmpF porin